MANNAARQALQYEYGFSAEKADAIMSKVTNGYTRIGGDPYASLNGNAPKEVKDIFQAMYGRSNVVFHCGDHAEIVLRNKAAELLNETSNEAIAEDIRAIGISNTKGSCTPCKASPELRDDYIPIYYLGKISSTFTTITAALGDVAWLL